MSAIIYLLQVSACLAIFYGFYYFMLNKLTFFTINRYYLLFTLLFSFVIPLLNIPIHQQYSAIPIAQQVVNVYKLQNLPVNTLTPIILKSTAYSVNWMQLIKWIYILAVAALFTRLLVMVINFFVNVKLKLKDRKISQIDNIHILHGNEELPNGSFLNYIFLNDDKLSPDELQQIIAHEMLHVKLCHSADRIIARVIQIILWFNPIVYLYARSMEENHEFQVDREVARSTDKSEYACLILHLFVAGQGMPYHSFSKVPVKKRISMLFNKPSANFKKIAYIFIIPVVLVSCLVFSHIKTDDDNRFSIVNNLDDLGKNPIVLIDNKAYPVDVLYNISNSCIKTSYVYTRKESVQRFGKKAKDGVVTITTVANKVVYMTATEKEDLVKERSIPASQLYTRLTLKDKYGKPYDKVFIHFPEGNWSSDLFTPDSKMGFLINKHIYNEEDFKSMLPDIISSIAHVKTSLPDPTLFPGIDIKGYTSVLVFRTLTADDSNALNYP